MPLVNCPECGRPVNGEAPVCPHCGAPRPGGPAAPPPSRAGSAGWVVFGVVVVGVLVLGLLGIGTFRLVESMKHPGGRRAEEIVDFADTVAGRGRMPDLRPAPPGDPTYEMGTVEVLPELLNREEVAAAISENYPPLLRDSGVTGSVTLRMRVRPDGTVDTGSVLVVESTHDAFSQAAGRVVPRMRFRPARVDGKLVPVWVTLPVTFRLAR